MKLPTKVFSHCLAHHLQNPPAITPNLLRKWLDADRKRGFTGMVIVPALIPAHYSPRAVIRRFKETDMCGLSCGFNAGNGPSPFRQPTLALRALRRPARIAAALAEKELGPPLMVGPIHTHHGQKMPGWSEDRLQKWGDALVRLAEEFDIEIAMEPLNKVEDKTPRPFQAVRRLATERERLRMHFDTGHAYAHGILITEFRQMAAYIRYFEFANVGRFPLAASKGIGFEVYAKAMTNLPEDCAAGDEPFDPSVITLFGLQKICKTKVLGTDCLEQDAAYLRDLGVMAETA